MAKLKCHSCGSPESEVKDSRPMDHGRVIRRRRACPRCGAKWTTYEIPEALYKRIHETQDVALQGLFKIATIAEHAIRTRKGIDDEQRF